MDKIVCCIILLTILGAFASEVDISCGLDGKDNACPVGYCCVRDEYLFTATHCKRIGHEGDPCVIRPSSFECPCAPNYHCKSNVQGHIISHFGTCHLNVDFTTESGMIEESTVTHDDHTKDGVPSVDIAVG